MLVAQDPSRWPRLAAWYEAMDAEVPAYSARVRGDEDSWRKVLAQAGYGNAGVPPDLVEEDAAHPQPAVGAWAAYAAGRPFVAATAAQEAAARIVRNRRWDFVKLSAVRGKSHMLSMIFIS